MLTNKLWYKIMGTYTFSMQWVASIDSKKSSTFWLDCQFSCSIRKIKSNKRKMKSHSMLCGPVDWELQYARPIPTFPLAVKASTWSWLYHSLSRTFLWQSALLYSFLFLSFSENRDYSVRSTATNKQDAIDLAALSSHQFLLWPL